MITARIRPWLALGVEGQPPVLGGGGGGGGGGLRDWEGSQRLAAAGYSSLSDCRAV